MGLVGPRIIDIGEVTDIARPPYRLIDNAVAAQQPEDRGQTFGTTHQKIQAEERQEPQKPPGIVHVAEVQEFEEAGSGQTVALRIEHGVGVLRNNRADDGG